MKINNLTIQAFRGIRDKIELDFSSALTVLYAANGTGKTSICDAVEWLFTGQLERLGIGLSDKLEGLRCSFAQPEWQTEVKADVKTFQRDIKLARNSRGVRVQAGGLWDDQEEREFLELLAPGLVDENVHGLSANAIRRGWLRGSRFLSGESLAVLLDSSADSSENRQRVFADILGTRSLVDVSRKVSRYLQRLKIEIFDAKKKDESLQQEIQHLRIRLGTPQSGDTSSKVKEEVMSAFNCISKISSAFGEFDLPNIANMDTAQAIDVIWHALARTNSRLEQTSKIISDIELNWSDRNIFSGRSQQLATKVGTLKSEIEGIQGQIYKEKSVIQAEEQQVTQLMTKFSNLVSLSGRCTQAIEHLSLLIQNYNELYNIANHSISELYTTVAEYKLSAEEIDARIGLVGQLLGTLQTWQFIPSEQARLNRRQAELNSRIKNLGDLQQLHGQYNQLQQVILSKRNQYDAMAGAVNRLRQAVNSAMSDLQTQSKCPACGTDFHSPKALASALFETMALIPPTQAALANEIRTNEVQLQQLESRIQQGMALVQELEQTQSRLMELGSLLRVKESEIGRLGLSWTVSLSEDLVRSQARLSVAKSMNNLLEAVIPLGIVDSSWGYGLEAFKSLLTQHTDQKIKLLHEQIEEKRLALEGFNNNKENALRNLNQRLIGLKQSEDQLEKVRMTEASINRLWKNLVGREVPWNDDTFGGIKAAHNGSLVQAKQAALHLDTARRIRELEEGSLLIIDRKEQLADLQKKIKDAQVKFDLANSVQELLENKIKNHTKEEIEALRSVVSPLFARMQANRVFDTVETGENPLDWLGMADGTALLPDKHFSQGQRQDLALAIFLARAKGLGGTFFLDEPLAHLDDLNRLALLDALRVMVVEEPNLNMVITTANRALVKHLVQKFARVKLPHNTRPLSVYELAGNSRVGVEAHFAR